MRDQVNLSAAPPTRESDERSFGDWCAYQVVLPVPAAIPVLAVGAETKGVFALAHRDRAWISVDHGVLTHPDNFRRFQQATIEAAEAVYFRPQLVARDLHPGYMSTEFATSLDLPVCVVQHHHAHIVSCMTEHGVVDPVIGICCDGAGCGVDKASWGCEILKVTTSGFERLGHLRYFELPGADQAAAQCWRPALSLAHRAFGQVLPEHVEALFADVVPSDRALAVQMMARGLQCPNTSSMGRMFDAVAFLLGICTHNHHEGEAAIKLQAAAESREGRALEVAVRPAADGFELDMAPAIVELCRKKRDGECVEQLSADFHATVAAMLAQAALAEARRTGLARVALSGGCFVNRILAGAVRTRLEREGLSVLEHSRVSCGDAGLAVGQVTVAAARMAASQSTRRTR